MMKYFSTLLPPPNLTGVLHLGHMWNAILQDTLIRYYRGLLGEDKCYWGYGVDHAGISLQIKVEEEIRKQGISKDSLSKEEFDRKLWEWKELHEDRITEQYSRLGYLLPFDEKRFTLDEKSKEYTLSVFRRLYEEKLIYRAERLVNWDTTLKTAISDAEVDYLKTNGKLYTIKYQVEGEDSYIEVSTTRPETILGDVAVFVHPEDERYVHLIGKNVLIPIIDKSIPVKSDTYIDISFGTGAMKCTPAHDFNDYELGSKYGLDLIEVFDSDLVVKLDPYKGLHRDKAKELIVKELLDKGLVTIVDYLSNVSYSSRSKTVIEPLLSKQWFVKSSELAKRALEFWRKDFSSMEVTKKSKNDELVFMFENMKDWCISRQLAWGIKIPVYLNDLTNEHSLEKGEGLRESEDVLDTWFSSSLWPNIVFHGRRDMLPLSVLISGKDILFFWIARMIFMSVYSEGLLPFKKIFLHGLVLDSKNRKMSKSLNNGIDPLVLIDKYSHDVVRLFFLGNTHEDGNISFSEQKLDYYARLVKKFENAAVFVGQKLEKLDVNEIRQESLNSSEKAIFKNFLELKEKLKVHFESFEFSFVVKEIERFLRDDFCGTYLEMYKYWEVNNKNNLVFLSALWKEFISLISSVIPDFSSGISCKFHSASLSDWNQDISLDPLIFWFEDYFKFHRSIRNKLAMPKSYEIKVRLFSALDVSSDEINSSLASLGHRFLGLENDERRANESEISVRHSSFVTYVDIGKEWVDKYRLIIEEDKKKIQQEIVFFERQINKFTFQTPEHIRQESIDKLEENKKALEFLNKSY
ncbi:valine--tRNA ligase [Candidatus Mycoplasma haematohominis]|uniref:Valine--tRNA ligase n=1 Tax=Candidatus Mycoplasma haematohominis TaxID=1494318 RepID=A0A478FQW6_9MOLU|nr:valine--tRNA ligase [Candidatus Mycoplasma haemohominis]